MKQRKAKAVAVSSVAVIGEVLSESPLNLETVIVSSVTIGDEEKIRILKDALKEGAETRRGCLKQQVTDLEPGLFTHDTMNPREEGISKDHDETVKKIK